MDKYYKHILFILILLFLLGSSPAFALEIKDYPLIPGYITPSSDCTGNDCLSIYIAYWFGLLVYITGVLAVIAFAIGAIRLIMSVENPEAHSDAIDRMKGALLGLVLTLSAFILLRTINLSLVTPSLTPLPGVAGIFYTNGSEDKPVGIEVENVANRGEDLVKNGFDKLIYKCTGDKNGGGTGPVLLIWEFPKINFQGNDANYSGVSVVRKNCGETEPIGGLGSFIMAFETPGIYYFMGQGCKGYMSSANLVTQDEIAAPFAGKIKSVRIVNSPSDNNYYGAIFHNIKGVTNAGDCLDPITIGTNSDCKNLSDYSLSSDFSANSVDIFLWNKDDPGSSGDGVVLYSEPDGWNTDKQAGQYPIASDEIKNYLTQDVTETIFDWSGVDSEIALWCGLCSDDENTKYEDCCPCATFQDCPGSLELRGSYLAAFYTPYNDKNNKNRLYCQTFKKDNADLSLEQFFPPENIKLDYIDIIPTK